jgi:hypothetical protein
MNYLFMPRNGFFGNTNFLLQLLPALRGIPPPVIGTWFRSNGADPRVGTSESKESLFLLSGFFVRRYGAKI